MAARMIDVGPRQPLRRHLIQGTDIRAAARTKRCISKKEHVMDSVKPPLPAQQQQVPGTTAEMDPRPDHGEDSYEGHGRLNDKKAVITGGDSVSAAPSP